MMNQVSAKTVAHPEVINHPIGQIRPQTHVEEDTFTPTDTQPTYVIPEPDAEPKLGFFGRVKDRLKAFAKSWDEGWKNLAKAHPKLEKIIDSTMAKLVVTGLGIGGTIFFALEFHAILIVGAAVLGTIVLVAGGYYVATHLPDWLDYLNAMQALKLSLRAVKDLREGQKLSGEQLTATAMQLSGWKQYGRNRALRRNQMLWNINAQYRQARGPVPLSATILAKMLRTKPKYTPTARYLPMGSKEQDMIAGEMLSEAGMLQDAATMLAETDRHKKANFATLCDALEKSGTLAQLEEFRRKRPGAATPGMNQRFAELAVAQGRPFDEVGTGLPDFEQLTAAGKLQRVELMLKGGRTNVLEELQSMGDLQPSERAVWHRLKGQALQVQRRFMEARVSFTDAVNMAATTENRLLLARAYLHGADPRNVDVAATPVTPKDIDKAARLYAQIWASTPAPKRSDNELMSEVCAGIALAPGACETDKTREAWIRMALRLTPDHRRLRSTLKQCLADLNRTPTARTAEDIAETILLDMEDDA